MLEKLYLLLLFVALAASDGSFIVVNRPDALSFLGDAIMESSEVGEILAASLGYEIEGYAEWRGLKIKDPFKLPNTAVVFEINGIDLNLPNSSVDVSYACAIQGDKIAASMKRFLSRVDRFEAELAGKSQNVLSEIFKTSKATELLNYTKLHKGFAQEKLKVFLENIREIGSNVADFMVAPNSEAGSRFLSLSIEMQPLVRSLAFSLQELQIVLDILELTVKHLQMALKNTYFVVITNQNPNKNKLRQYRFKRDTKDQVDDDPTPSEKTIAYMFICNIEDPKFPPMFQIIFWTSVGLGMALLAAAYALATIDPGTNSIIYRVTSGKMKKF